MLDDPGTALPGHPRRHDPVAEVSIPPPDSHLDAAHRFRLAMFHAEIGMCINAPSGQFIEVNPALCDFLDRDAADLVARTWADVTHPADRDATRVLNDELLAGRRRSYRRRNRYVRTDGTLRWGDLQVSAIRDPEGRPRYLVSQLVDVTAEVHATEEVATSEAALRALLRSSPDSVIAFDPNLRVQFTNANAVTPEGGTTQHGRELADLDLAPEALTRHRYALTDTLRTGRSHTYTFDSGRTGHTRHLETRTAPIIDAIGECTGVVAVTRDLTEQHDARVALETSERRYRTISNAATVGMALVDETGTFTEVNPALCAILGRDAVELVGDEWRNITHPLDIEVDERSFAALVAGSVDSYRLRKRFRGAAETTVWGDLCVAAIRDDAGHFLYGVKQVVDVTNEVMAQDHALEMATHDHLTGLANRVEMRDELDRALAAGSRGRTATVVLVLDLDRFKLVNDSFGHGTGDTLIRAAAARISEGVRSEDLVARLGGDEFVVVMRDLASPADAVDVGWRIVEAFRRPFVLDAGTLYATTSIGLAVATLGADGEQLLSEADTAMYCAKADGGDRLSVFNTELRDIVTRRVTLEADLRRAVDDDELETWYQPDVDLDTGSVVAAEALVRWRRPDGDVWTAGEFIDIAEETGLVVAVGNKVLLDACRTAAGWRNSPDHPAPQLRVNLAAAQLNDITFLDTLDAALADSGLDPERLCVEITETVLLRRTATVESNIDGLHARGINIASDDFGTGYASLAQLRDHPIDLIKIDRSFITDLATDDRSRRLVTGTIALAQSIGLDVTAEGVETPAQAEILRGLGCLTAQGYLFGRAVPADVFAARLDVAHTP